MPFWHQIGETDTGEEHRTRFIGHSSLLTNRLFGQFSGCVGFFRCHAVFKQIAPFNRGHMTLLCRPHLPRERGDVIFWTVIAELVQDTKLPSTD